MARNSRGAIDPAGKCTPCAPAASATSMREFTSTFDPCGFGERERTPREIEQIPRAQILLANLDELHAIAHGARDESQQRFGTARGPAIGYVIPQAQWLRRPEDSQRPTMRSTKAIHAPSGRSTLRKSAT